MRHPRLLALRRGSLDVCEVRVGTRRTAVLVGLTGLDALVRFVVVASLGPETTVVCGTGPLLDRAAQRAIHALGAGAVRRTPPVRGERVAA